jgi:hypothetical protein
VVNDGTARGNADSSTSLGKFDMVDVLGAIGNYQYIICICNSRLTTNDQMLYRFHTATRRQPS